MSEYLLKDQLFNRQKVAYLASLFAAQEPTFPRRQFVARVMQKLPALELKQRITLIAETLYDCLPRDYPDAVRQIVASLPPPLDDARTDDDFGDFILAPLGAYVASYGLAREHLALSLSALREITQRFSMEDALRAFIRRFPQETLGELTRWAEDPNYHVRRLVSESTRPLLPWSGRIELPVDATLPLLETLHADRTRYVTRSVANHLNDLSKTHPELVVQTLQRWHDRARQDRDELRWMSRHALRTLVKRGDAGALRLLGFDPSPQLRIGELRLARSHLRPGETLQFSVDISAVRDESVVVDYVIDFVKAGGKRSAKVFKAATFSLNQGETRTVSKNHKLHAQATTYQLYAGEHRLTLQINGRPVGSQSFMIAEA
jgi:3-methyladenine DNA glycosylase AlkC